MTTASDLITLALQDAGITGLGLTPQKVDINNGLTRLNDIIAQWQRNRWLIWHDVATDLAMTGATSYTVGPGGQFNIARPDQIEAARVIQNNPPPPNDVGWPLEVLKAREDYERVRMQHLSSFPRWIWYDSVWPIGLVYPWPIPSNIYTLRIVTKEVLQTFPNLATVYNMPPEYSRTLRFALQSELLMAYKLPPDPILEKKLAAALDNVKAANFQLPLLQMPMELVRPGVYNVFSDNVQ